jgi:hypothetical protein
MPAPTPPPGFANTTCNAIYAGSGFSIQQLVSAPTMIVNDVFVVKIASIPAGYTGIVNGDGTMNCLCGGDNSRQAYPFYIWRSATNIVEGPHTVYFNEFGPVWGGFSVSLLTAITQVAIPSFDFTLPGFASSPEGDLLTFALATGTLPNNVTLSSAGLLSGTPTIAGTYTFTVNATDLVGKSTSSGSFFIVVSAPVNPQPPVIIGTGANMWSADGNYQWTADGFPGWSADGYEPTPLSFAVADLAAKGISVGTLTYAYSSDGTPVGWVITGYPWLAVSLPAGSYANLVISNGPPPPGTIVVPPSVVGMYYYDAQQKILAAGLRIAFPIFVLSGDTTTGGALLTEGGVPLLTETGVQILLESSSVVAGVLPGYVISQSLPANAPVPAGTLMTITAAGFPVILQPATTVEVP